MGSIGLPHLGEKNRIRFDRPVLPVTVQVVYTTLRTFNSMSMSAITIRTWIQLPRRGSFGLRFRPKKPSSHRMIRITIIVHNMRALLLNDL
jgi:hypothetical protein